MKNKKLDTNSLAKLRTLLANERTYLSYIRTGFATTLLAVTIKNDIVIIIGTILILFGLYQYYTIATNLENNEIIYPNKNIPIIFSISGIMIVYYYWTKFKPKRW